MLIAWRFFRVNLLNSFMLTLIGKHVVVSTSTASGKSLCYNLPVIEALNANRKASAIYVFPTKALAQDQLRALREFLTAAFPNETPIADVYDGDTDYVRIRILIVGFLHSLVCSCEKSSSLKACPTQHFESFHSVALTS